MNTVEFIFYIQLILFIVLVVTCFYVTFNKKDVGNIPKWIIAVCSITILALADRFKLIAALGLVGIIYIIKYFHRKKKQHGINSHWKLDS